MSQQEPLCFTIMPFGQKPDPSGRPDIDFDRIYSSAIEPAIQDAGLEPIRADGEKTGGIIHKAMFERLLLCEFAVADLTTANANVFYELGVRHTGRPATTQAIFGQHQPIPFDVKLIRGMPYDLGPNNQFGDNEAKTLRKNLTERLLDLKESHKIGATVDSPVFELVAQWNVPPLSKEKTNSFFNDVVKSRQFREVIERARNSGRPVEGLNALRLIPQEESDLICQEAGVIIDLLLSYRSLSGWDEMVGLVNRMPETLQRQPLVREQLAFALNRRAAINCNPSDRQSALKILLEVLDSQGPNAETCGLIGRIYKDMWIEARENDEKRAQGFLKKAIASYEEGFLADWREAYPGVNAITLLEIKGDPDSLEQFNRLLPIVRFAVERRLKGRVTDYWDHSTMLELAVLERDLESAEEHLSDTLSAVPTPDGFQLETTARNLELINQARVARGDEAKWLREIIELLRRNIKV